MSRSLDTRSKSVRFFASHKKSTKTDRRKDPDVPDDVGLRNKLGEINEMTNDGVNSMLFSMLNDMELPEHSKPSIFTRPLSERKDLLKIWIQKRWDSSSQGQSTQEDFVEQLEQSMGSPDQLILVLERLKVSLSTYYISWVQKFADKGGHKKLNKILIKWNLPTLNKDEKAKKVLLYCVRCIKTFMNNKFGLHHMLEEEEALITLLGVLDPDNENILVDVLKIAAPICLVANGHDKVLEALTEQGNRRDRGRFDPVIKALLDTDLPSTQSACLLFINSIISPPDEFTYRIHLRNEFIRAGLDEFIQKVNQTASDDLAVQLKIYNDLKEADFDELQSKWHGVQADLMDVSEVFQILMGITENTEAEKPFLSILQHLLLVRDDYFIRPMYFKLIEQCITQIVLQKGGVDPDFNYTKKFDIDVDPLIDSMVVKAQVEEARERAVNYERQLKEEQVARHDLESKLTTSEQTLNDVKEELEYKKQYYEQQISQLQKGGNVSIAPPPPRPNVKVDIPMPPRNLPEVEALLPPVPKQALILGNRKIPAPPPNLPEVDEKLGISSNRGKPHKNTLDLPKKKVREKLSTKRLNWVKVKETEMNESAFWTKLREDKLENPDIIADLKKLFGQEGRRPVEKEKPETPASHCLTNSYMGGRRAQEPQVLEAKTCQNLSILLMSLKYPHEQIKKMILSMDDALGLQWLEQLAKYLPSTREITQLNKVKDKFHEMNQAEQFILVITKIDRLVARLDTMIFRKKFKDEITDLVPDLRLVKKACNEIKNSPKFAKILEYILMMGNVMNAGTNNAGSYGFNLEFLTKLEDTKGVSDHSTTVLNFLVTTLEKHDAELLKFARELESVSGASRVSYADLKQRIRSIQTSIEDIRAELKHYKSVAKDHNDLYGEVMTQFLTSAEGESQNVRKLHKEMEDDVTHLLNWYAMDSQKITMEELFRYIKDFVRSFDKAKKQNEEMKEKKKREEKAKKRLEEMKKKQNNTKPRVARTGVVNLEEIGDDKSENVLDNLLDSLRTGKAFDTRFARPRRSKPLQMEQIRPQLSNDSRAYHSAVSNEKQHKQEVNGNSPMLPHTNSYGRYQQKPQDDHQPSQAQMILDRMQAQPSAKTLPPNSESTFL